MSKVLRKASDIPDWYPLDIYDNEKSAVEWHEALFQRLMLQAATDATQDTSKVIELFRAVLIDGDKLKHDFFTDVPSLGELWGITSLSAYELAYLASMMLESEQGRVLIDLVQTARKEKNIDALCSDDESLLQEAKKREFGECIDWKIEPFQMPDVLPRFPLSIDLDQDDETLKLAFEVFLAGIRDSTGPAKRAFDNRDFSDWKRYGVLQIFDLQLWARIHNARYTYSLLAKTIWPYEDVDVTERMRKIARPKAKVLFDDWSTISRLRRQIELEKSLNALAEERNEKAPK